MKGGDPQEPRGQREGDCQIWQAGVASGLARRGQVWRVLDFRPTEWSGRGEIGSDSGIGLGVAVREALGVVRRLAEQVCATICTARPAICLSEFMTLSGRCATGQVLWNEICGGVLSCG